MGDFNSLRLSVYDFIPLYLHLWQWKCSKLLQFQFWLHILYFEWTLRNFELLVRFYCFSFISCRLWHFFVRRFHFRGSFLFRWRLFCRWIVTRSKLCIRGLHYFFLDVLQRRIRININIDCIILPLWKFAFRGDFLFLLFFIDFQSTIKYCILEFTERSVRNWCLFCCLPRFHNSFCIQ